MKKTMLYFFSIISLFSSFVLLSTAINSTPKQIITICDWKNVTIDENDTYTFNFSIPVDSLVKSSISGITSEATLSYCIVDENGIEKGSKQFTSAYYTNDYLTIDLKKGNYALKVIVQNASPYSSKTSFRFSITSEIFTDIQANSIKINKSTISLPEKCRFQLSAEIEPLYCTYTTQWSSSNKNVATVDNNGLVSTINTGKTQIKAKIGNKESICNVEVKKPKKTIKLLEKNNIVVGESITNRFKVSLPVKAIIRIASKEPIYNNFEIIITDSSDKVIHSINNYSISYFDESFIELPKGEFTLNVYSKTTPSFKCSLSATAYIYSDIAVSSISLSKASSTLSVSEKMQLSVKYTPKNTTFSPKWSSSNNNVASVDKNGLVKANALGSATIYCTMGNKREKCTVLVNQRSATYYVYQKENSSILKYFNNIKNINKAKWKSSDTKVAKVKNGTVYGISSGNCFIIATVSKQRYKFRIDVPEVEIEKSALNIYVGSRYNLSILGTSSKVTWSSSNSKVASVNSKGVVKGVSPGSATITGTVHKNKYICIVKIQKLTYGRIEGTVLYYYNNFFGYRADSGASVYITDNLDDLPEIETFTDADGKYSVRVPANRTYKVNIYSTNTHLAYKKSVYVKTNEIIEVSKRFR